MDRTWWRIPQFIFGPLIVAILFTAGREIVVEVSGDGTVTTNGIRVYSEPFAYTNVIVNGERMLTNSPPFSAHDLIFKAKSNGELTNLVNELVASGEFCRVRGHVWGAFAEQYLYAVMRPEGYQARKCHLCGTVQERSLTAWPTP